MSDGTCVSDLLLVSVGVDPRCLEDVLDKLARSRYRIHPQVCHPRGIVEFPAYAEWLPEIRSLLRGWPVETVGMLDSIRAARATAA